MSDCFILLAAGKSKRFKSNIPKQFICYKNKPLFMHSIDKALKSNLFKQIILVSSSAVKSLKNKKITIIRGGEERYQSSQKALDYINKKKIKNVFIHDAARPNFSINLLKKLKKNLKKNKAVIPYINTDHSTKYKNKNKIINLKREKVLLTQTPQCFDFKTLYKLSKTNKKIITDEATLFLENNKNIKFIKGEKDNTKITTRSDLKKNLKTYYGIGFDIHKLVKNKKKPATHCKPWGLRIAPGTGQSSSIVGHLRTNRDATHCFLHLDDFLTTNDLIKLWQRFQCG